MYHYVPCTWLSRVKLSSSYRQNYELTQNSVVVENLVDLHINVFYPKLEVQLVDVKVGATVAVRRADGTLDDSPYFVKATVERAVSASR